MKSAKKVAIGNQITFSSSFSGGSDSLSIGERNLYKQLQWIQRRLGFSLGERYARYNSDSPLRKIKIHLAILTLHKNETTYRLHLRKKVISKAEGLLAKINYIHAFGMERTVFFIFLSKNSDACCSVMRDEGCH